MGQGDSLRKGGSTEAEVKEKRVWVRDESGVDLADKKKNIKSTRPA